MCCKMSRQGSPANDGAQQGVCVFFRTKRSMDRRGKRCHIVVSSFRSEGRVAGRSTVASSHFHITTRPQAARTPQRKKKSGARSKEMWCLLGARRYRHCARDGKAKKVDVCKRQFRVDSSLQVVRACAWLMVSPLPPPGPRLGWGALG